MKTIRGIKIKTKKFPGCFHFTGITKDEFLKQFTDEFQFYVFDTALRFYVSDVIIEEF